MISSFKFSSFFEELNFHVSINLILGLGENLDPFFISQKTSPFQKKRACFINCLYTFQRLRYNPF